MRCTIFLFQASSSAISPRASASWIYCVIQNKFVKMHGFKSFLQIVAYFTKEEIWDQVNWHNIHTYFSCSWFLFIISFWIQVCILVRRGYLKMVSVANFCVPCGYTFSSFSKLSPELQKCFFLCCLLCSCLHFTFLLSLPAFSPWRTSDFF